MVRVVNTSSKKNDIAYGLRKEQKVLKKLTRK